MVSDRSLAAPAALPEGRFGGRSEFGVLVRQALAAAATQGWPEIIWCDPDFADWPLGERVVAQALNDWSSSGRKLTLLAVRYDVMLGRHARFVTWRRTWSHLVECRKCSAASADNLPSALWSPVWMFERLDIQRSIGVTSSDAVRRIALKERLNERLLNSSAGFGASVLGL